MKISMIVARDAETHGIGYKGKLIYRIREDMDHFVNLTMNTVVIMGRKTYESIGQPLDGRINIVLTKDESYKAPGCVVLNSKEEVLYILENFPYDYVKQAYVIGGESIYKKFENVCDEIQLTEIYTKSTEFYHIDNPKYDTVFEVNESLFGKVSESDIQNTEIQCIDFKFVKYESIKTYNVTHTKEIMVRHYKNKDKMDLKIMEIQSLRFLLYTEIFSILNESYHKIYQKRKELFKEDSNMKEIDSILSSICDEINNYHSQIADIVDGDVAEYYSNMYSIQNNK